MNEPTHHPAMISAMQLEAGRKYIRIVGLPDPYRFVPVETAPIGTVGEYITAVGPGEWYGGTLVAVRPQGADAPPPLQSVPSPGPRFDDPNLEHVIDQALTTDNPNPSMALRDKLHEAARIAASLGLDSEKFQMCAAVALAEVTR